MLSNQFQILLVEVFLFTSTFLFPFSPVALALFDLFVVVIDESFLNLSQQFSVSAPKSNCVWQAWNVQRDGPLRHRLRLHPPRLSR